MVISHTYLSENDTHGQNLNMPFQILNTGLFVFLSNVNVGSQVYIIL